MLFGQEAGAYSNCRMYRTGAIATTRASFQWQRCAKKTGLLTSALSRALKLIGHEDCGCTPGPNEECTNFRRAKSDNIQIVCNKYTYDHRFCQSFATCTYEIIRQQGMAT